MSELRAAVPAHPFDDVRRNGRGTLTSDTRYRLLLEVFHSTRGTLDLHETLDRLLDALQLLVPFDAAGIFVLRDEVAPPRVGALVEQIAGVSWRGFPPRSPLTDPMLRDGKGIVGHVIRTGEVVCAADVRLDPRYIEGREATRSEVAVPIQLDGRTIGAFNLESDVPAAFRSKDVEVLSFFAEATAMAVEKAMLHQRLTSADELDRQIRTAQRVQERLLPTELPDVPGHELAGICLPSTRVGGDYFDFVPVPGGQMGLIVADVSGHGLSAAIIMSAFRALARTCLRAGQPLDKVAETLDRELPDTTAGGAFVTAVLAMYDPESGLLRYVNCGHHPPLLDRAGQPPRWLTEGGPLLGLIEGASFEIGEVQLVPDDQLVIFTDGIVEARSSAGVWFGKERLAEAVAANRDQRARELVERVVLEARALSGGHGLEDDATMLLLRRTSPRAR
jgi:sigma-B regulation protein RsbU (phosphoserine phosphatase)